jgi:Helix-turn-helix
MLRRGFLTEMYSQAMAPDSPTAQVGLLDSVRALIETGAGERATWIRENLAALMRAAGRDAVGMSALSGVSPTTVRAFINGTDSSVTNVLKMAMTLGVSLGDLERSPEEFAALMDRPRE